MLLPVATRSETAAMTRRSLLEAAGALLDTGGPDAVTLREVGARTGVSRSAPYRHFMNKETLLTALAANALNQLGDTLKCLAGSDDPPEQSLRAALLSLVAIGRTRPHLYRLMFTTPAGDPTAAVRAAERTQEAGLPLQDFSIRGIEPEHESSSRTLVTTACTCAPRGIPRPTSSS